MLILFSKSGIWEKKSKYRHVDSYAYKERRNTKSLRYNLGPLFCFPLFMTRKVEGRMAHILTSISKIKTHCMTWNWNMKCWILSRRAKGVAKRR